MNAKRSLPGGAEIVPGGVQFRVWAPSRKRVEVVAGGVAAELRPEENGYFSGLVPALEAGALYRYRLDGGDEFPDPFSRYQPEGPHGPSEAIDPSRFAWTDEDWQGLPLRGQTIYEMHVGTFTREGSWASAIEELPRLARLGIGVLELMPVAEFTGNFGWGYDGVDLFAPTRLYGRPDDMRRFVDAAHRLGMAVILDVVYNHVGADGNYLGQFSPDYFSDRHTTDWGDAINFDGPNCGPVRDFFIANARYWVEEFHIDGLRIDATQNVYDDSSPHILMEITRAVREAARGRHTIVIAENEPQETMLVREWGMDGLWNDDLHHSATVALTGHNDAYYTDYNGAPQEFVSAMKYGYLYQGQWYKWQNKRRGTPTFGLEPHAFVNFIQNHDQIANSAQGTRIHRETTPGLLKAVTTLILAGPGTPMLFQGQEYGAPQPFLYFADVPESLREAVRKGRKEFVSQWRTIRMPEMAACLPDPCSRESFERCKLDSSQADPQIAALHADLLKLRREDPALASWSRGSYDGAVLGSHAFAIRAFNEAHGDRLIVVNLGMDLHLSPAPEPLLGPPEGGAWRILFSTEHPRYGGCGTAPLDSEENWRIPGRSAVILAPAIKEMK